MLGTGLPIRAEGSREGSPEVSAKANSATRPANATTGMMTHESPREARGGASAALVVPPCSSTGLCIFYSLFFRGFTCARSGA